MKNEWAYNLSHRLSTEASPRGAEESPPSPSFRFWFCDAEVPSEYNRLVHNILVLTFFFFKFSNIKYQYNFPEIFTHLLRM